MHSPEAKVVPCIPPGCDTVVKTPSLLWFFCVEINLRLLMFSCYTTNGCSLGYTWQHGHRFAVDVSWLSALCWLDWPESWLLVMAFQLLELNPDVINCRIQAVFHQMISNWMSDMKRETTCWPFSWEKMQFIPKTNNLCQVLFHRDMNCKNNYIYFSIGLIPFLLIFSSDREANYN